MGVKNERRSFCVLMSFSFLCFSASLEVLIMNPSNVKISDQLPE